MVSFLALFRGPDTDLVPDFSPGPLTGLGNALPHIFLSAEREVIAFELDITPSAIDIAVNIPVSGCQNLLWACIFQLVWYADVIMNTRDMIILFIF